MAAEISGTSFPIWIGTNGYALGIVPGAYSFFFWMSVVIAATASYHSGQDTFPSKSAQKVQNRLVKIPGFLVQAVAQLVVHLKLCAGDFCSDLSGCVTT